MRTEMVRGYNSRTQQNQVQFGQINLKLTGGIADQIRGGFVDTLCKRINENAVENGTKGLKINAEYSNGKLKLMSKIKSGKFWVRDKKVSTEMDVTQGVTKEKDILEKIGTFLTLTPKAK